MSTPPVHVYSDWLQAIQYGDWILVWALDFLYQSKVALRPSQPPVEWVQVYFPGGNGAMARSLYPGLEINFWSLGSLISVSSVPLGGWYGV
jgi:hypothetical protein